MFPTISIVIVSWNVSQLLRNCIRSIYASEGQFNLEIIVVDNNSSDDTTVMIKKEFPGVLLICNKTNPGFAKANNQGFKIAKGEYIFILNPDTEIDKNCIALLLKALKSSAEIGMTGPKLVFDNGKIQSTCARKLPDLKSYLLNQSLRLNRLVKFDEKEYDRSVPGFVQAISGAAMFIKKDFLINAGMFNDEYIHCGEDLELCYRVNNQNKKILYVPDAYVIHHEGQSSKQNFIRTGVNMNISVQKYYLHTQGKFASVAFRAMICFIEIPVNLTTAVVKFLTGGISKENFSARLKLAWKTLQWKPL